MRPRRLAVDGFGTFRERVEVDFTDVDLVALVGPTGSGKSTVIDAITFALYGSVARYDDNRNVVNAINQTSTRARVQLEFEVGDRVYTAVRVVQRTATGATTKEARLESDGEVLASDARGMTASIEALLGLDVDQFNRTVVLPQGRFAGFLHDSPANRQRTLRQLLGFEVYNRIGQAARDRAKRAELQATTIEEEIADRASRLTADDRGELQQAFDLSRAVIERVQALSQEREGLAGQLDPLQRRSEQLSTDVDALNATRIPDDADQIDALKASTAAVLEAAVADREQTRAAALAAAEAVRTGPDLARVTLQLRQVNERASAAVELSEATAGLASAEAALQTATEAAGAVERRQRNLDDAVQGARAREADAKCQVDSAPSAAQLGSWRHLHDQPRSLIEQLDAAERDLAAATEALAPLVVTLEAATRAADAARVAYEHARTVSGASALVASLAAGQPCPICRQTVTVVPDHDVDAELAAAQAEHDARQRELNVATAAHVQAADQQRAAEIVIGSLRSNLQTATDRLADVPTLAEIEKRQAEVDRLTQQYETARAEFLTAQTSADGYRRDETTIAALAARDTAEIRVASAHATVEATRRRLDALDAELADIPDAAALELMIDTAKRLGAAASDANAERLRAEVAVDEATTGAQQAREAHAAATMSLLAEREQLGRLDPPEISGDRLADSCNILANWIADTRRRLMAELATTRDSVQELSRRVDSLDASIRSECARVLDGDLDGQAASMLRERLAARSGELAATLAAFDQEIEQLDRQRQRVQSLRDEAAVASELGRLLRADHFEAWLMESALGGLANAASDRLRELSGGQFSLELRDGSFMVRDHANADELRSAKTLSGGETFLASLSLALALADATTQLAAEGAPPIESIFLDEGFGTLDATTLDLVAAAIEELGASGRLVGIVTHIHELADRMPIRLEVSKTGGTSTIERIEA